MLGLGTLVVLGAKGLKKDGVEYQTFFDESVQGLEVEGWKARQVARLTHRLTLEQARRVDTQVVAIQRDLDTDQPGVCLGTDHVLRCPGLPRCAGVAGWWWHGP